MDKNQVGVNLLELLIVLSIVGILMLTAIPSVINMLKTHRLSATAEQLYYHLQYARSEAIKTNSTMYVSFVTGDSWCYGTNSGSACDCRTASNCNRGTANAAAAQQLSLSTTGLSSNSVQFEGSHGAANASGSITLSLYNDSATLIKITVGRFGGVQMCSTGISGYTGC